MEAGGEIACGFLVACGDTSEVLDGLEESFNIPYTLPLII